MLKKTPQNKSSGRYQIDQSFRNKNCKVVLKFLSKFGAKKSHWTITKRNVKIIKLRDLFKGKVGQLYQSKVAAD